MPNTKIATAAPISTAPTVSSGWRSDSLDGRASSVSGISATEDMVKAQKIDGQDQKFSRTPDPSMPAPARPREMISIAGFGARIGAAEAMANTTSPNSSAPRRPNRSPSAPAGSNRQAITSV